MTARLLLTVATTLLCTLAHGQDIGTAAFLAGNWTEKTERGETQEMWTAPRGDMMAAVNSSLRGGRAGVLERVPRASRAGVTPEGVRRGHRAGQRNPRAPR